MSVAEETGRHGIGGNNPPLPLKDQLEKTYADALQRAASLEATAATIPEVIVNDQVYTDAADVVKAMKVLKSTLDAGRKAEKEPFLARGKLVDAFFGKPIDLLDGVIKGIGARISAYQQKKEDEARRAREEEARKQREEAEARQRAAEEAERRRLEAEAATRKAEEERQRAEDARRAAAENERRAKAEADAAEERAKQAERERKEAERRAAEAKKQREDDEARSAEAAERERIATQQAAEAEERGRRERAAQAQAEEERRKAQEERARQRAAEDLAEEQRKTAAAVGREARKTENANMDAALRHERAADKHDRAAQADVNDLVRGRGDLGAVVTTTTRWTFEIEAYDLIPILKIRGFFTDDEIKAAVARFVRGGGRELPGVRIFEDRNELVL